MKECSHHTTHHLKEGGKREKESERRTVSVVRLIPKASKQEVSLSNRKEEKEEMGLVRMVPYLVASLGLSNQNEGIGADNGEAEVDEDH